MYDIFIKNFYRNGVLVKDEARLYSIPIQEGDQDNVLTDPIVSTEVGKTGSFEEGYAFDALVLDDLAEPAAHPLSVRDRLERAFYLELDRQGIAMKIADGEIIIN